MTETVSKDVVAQDISTFAQVKPRKDRDLSTITSFEARKAEILASENYVSAEDLGDGYSLLRDKDELIGVPFIIDDWYHGTKDEYGNRFIIVKLTTSNDDKFLITDGSTGIRDQIERQYIADGGVKREWYCEYGLIKSSYWISDATKEVVADSFAGKKSRAHTHFIANS